MPDDYWVSLSRTPDGHFIITTDPTVPLAHDCVTTFSEGQEATVFIRLDVVHKGRTFPVWYCDNEGRANEADWQKVIDERKPEIVEALRHRETKNIQK